MTSEVVLLTGAAGWVGRALLAELREAGYFVVATDLHLRTPCEPARGVAWHAANARHVDALRGAIGERVVRHVVHAAAVTAEPEREPRAVAAYLGDHLASVEACLRIAAEHAATATLISSAAVFAADPRCVLDEQAEPRGKGPYATAKRAAELAWMEMGRAGLDARVVRFGNLFSPDEVSSGTRPRLSLLGRYVHEATTRRRIEVLALAAERDWTYLPDAARRVVTDLADGDAPRLRHAVAGGVLRDEELARRTAGVLAPVRVEAASTPAPLPRTPLVTLHPKAMPDAVSTLEALNTTIRALASALEASSTGLTDS